MSEKRLKALYWRDLTPFEVHGALHLGGGGTDPFDDVWLADGRLVLLEAKWKLEGGNVCAHKAGSDHPRGSIARKIERGLAKRRWGGGLDTIFQRASSSLARRLERGVRDVPSLEPLDHDGVAPLATFVDARLRPQFDRAFGAGWQTRALPKPDVHVVAWHVTKEGRDRMARVAERFEQDLRSLKLWDFNRGDGPPQGSVLLPRP